MPHRLRFARGPALDLPDAAWIGRVAATRITTAGDADGIEPLYVRPPDATPASPKSPTSG